MKKGIIVFPLSQPVKTRYYDLNKIWLNSEKELAGMEEQVGKFAIGYDNFLAGIEYNGGNDEQPTGDKPIKKRTPGRPRKTASKGKADPEPGSGKSGDPSEKESPEKEDEG